MFLRFSYHGDGTLQTNDRSTIFRMATKLFQLDDESDRLEFILAAIDKIVFEDDPEEGLNVLGEIGYDEDLVTECMRWRQRFSEPDAESVKNKW